MGRVKKPSHLQAIEGNPAKRPINKKEPKPTKGVPEVPEYFNEREAYWFNEIGNKLDKYGVMTTLDAHSLEMLIKAYSEYREADEGIKAEGMIIKTVGYNKQPVTKTNPLVPIRADAWKKVTSILKEFGMTPSSRTKIVSDNPEGKDDSSSEVMIEKYY